MNRKIIGWNIRMALQTDNLNEPKDLEVNLEVELRNCLAIIYKRLR